MKYGTMTYISIEGYYNVGDYIQSLAAMQYLPEIDYYLNREQLDKYHGEKMKMILNGWFMHKPTHWPPSNSIDPLFVSFHMNHLVEDHMLIDGKAEYLRKNAPIGCRDHFTVKKLRDHGIDAYYSSCLTTTLDIKYKSEEKDGKIYIVDPLWTSESWKTVTKDVKTFIKSFINGNILKVNDVKTRLKQLIDPEILSKAEYLTHEYKETENEQTRFERAESLLRKYARAQLVITSRIHCALPCLALGTPVIFINGGFNKSTDICRFDGIIDNFNTINIDNEGNLNTNFDFKQGDRIRLDTIKQNPLRYKTYSDMLKKKCKEFIHEESGSLKDVAVLGPEI